MVFIFLTQFLPDWFQFFTVSTPRSIFHRTGGKFYIYIYITLHFANLHSIVMFLFAPVAAKHDRAQLTEFNEDILGFIKGHSFKVFGYYYFDRIFIPVLRNLLAHHVRLGKKTQLY